MHVSIGSVGVYSRDTTTLFNCIMLDTFTVDRDRIREWNLIHAVAWCSDKVGHALVNYCTCVRNGLWSKCLEVISCLI